MRREKTLVNQQIKPFFLNFFEYILFSFLTIMLDYIALLQFAYMKH